MEDVIKLVREQYCLPESVVVEIEGVQMNKKDDHEWQDVPSDWPFSRPVPEAQMYDAVDVVHRDGDITLGHNHHIWPMWWKQDNNTWNIVKFRKAI